MLEDRFRAWGLGSTGSLVEIKVVRKVDLVRNRSWLWGRRPVDGGVKGAVEPSHVGVFEPSKE